MPSSSSIRKRKRLSGREKDGLGHAHRKLGVRGRERNRGRIGHHKQKWTSEEEAALLGGVAKHGAGKWKNILKDPDFSQPLAFRSNIDLKDKWRNLSTSHELEQVPKKKKKKKNPKSSIRFTLPSLSLPKGASRNVVIDSKTEERYTALIFEALLTMKDPDGSNVGAIRDFIQQRNEEPTPQNFKRVVGARLRSLVSLGKLEKTSRGFKIKGHSILGTKAPRELATFTETEDDAVLETASILADAENKSFLAAEAMKEAESVSMIAEETESMLLLVKEIYEQCSCGYYILDEIIRPKTSFPATEYRQPVLPHPQTSTRTTINSISHNVRMTQKNELYKFNSDSIGYVRWFDVGNDTDLAGHKKFGDGACPDSSPMIWPAVYDTKKAPTCSSFS